MPNDPYTTLLNLELFHNLVALLWFQRLQKDFEVTKNVNVLKLEGHLGEL